jgi:hypothetical protein
MRGGKVGRNSVCRVCVTAQGRARRACNQTKHGAALVEQAALRVEGLRACRACDSVKPLSAFRRLRKTKSAVSLASWCAACENERGCVPDSERTAMINANALLRAQGKFRCFGCGSHQSLSTMGGTNHLCRRCRVEKSHSAYRRSRLRRHFGGLVQFRAYALKLLSQQ